MQLWRLHDQLDYLAYDEVQGSRTDVFDLELRE